MLKIITSVPGLRDSSGSEVTLGDDSLSGYFEPFGKALPPAPSDRDDVSGRGRDKCRDSIACSEADLELVLGAVGHKRQQLQQQQLLACMLHSKGQQQHPQQQQQKQLKGILKKESSFSKSASITTNPTANVMANIGSDRESSASCSPPPLSEPVSMIQVSVLSYICNLHM
jgi:hypothetical protein